MRASPLLFALAAAAFPAAICAAQQGIDPTHKFSWSENCGWMNWDGSPGQGASVHATYLTGYIWCENVGWLSLSSSAVPADGHAFANSTGENHGVNIEPGTGSLFGLAWGENIGWVNFSGGALASPPNPARLDSGPSRFRGFAWAENIGWINLDDAVHYVGLGCGACAADFDCSGTLAVPDIFSFLSAWFAQSPRADIDSNGAITVPDIFSFLGLWFAGCP